MGVLLALLAGCGSGELSILKDRIVVHAADNEPVDLTAGTATWRERDGSRELVIQLWGGSECDEIPVFPEVGSTWVVFSIPEDEAVDGRAEIEPRTSSGNFVGASINYFGQTEEDLPAPEYYSMTRGFLERSFKAMG